MAIGVWACEFGAGRYLDLELRKEAVALCCPQGRNSRAGVLFRTPDPFGLRREHAAPWFDA